MNDSTKEQRAEFAKRLRELANQVDSGPGPNALEINLSTFVHSVESPIFPEYPEGPIGSSPTGYSLVIHVNSNDQQLFARLWKKFGSELSFSFGGGK